MNAALRRRQHTREYIAGVLNVFHGIRGLTPAQYVGAAIFGGAEHGEQGRPVNITLPEWGLVPGAFDPADGAIPCLHRDDLFYELLDVGHGVGPGHDHRRRIQPHADRGAGKLGQDVYESIAGLVPGPVADYIAAEGLYV